MKIAVAGTGYVGLSIATLLAQHHEVMAVDIIEDKVNKINNRISPIQDEYIEKYLKEKELNLTATLNAEDAYKDAVFVIIAAPTNYDSKKNFFDTSAVESVIQQVMEINPDAIMVIKSTIPVGYTQSIREKTGSKNEENVMSKVKVMDHPLIQHKIGIMRRTDTGSKDFRTLVSEVAMLECYEATRDLELTDVEIETPICKATVKELKGKKLAVVPILRAGLGMVEGMLELIPAAKVGHIGMYRDPETAEPIEYYCKLPADCANREVFVVDPMLATGGSAVAALDMLKKRGVKNIHFMCIIAAPEGVKRLTEEHPDVDVYIGALDDHLNEHKYIVPGLGDAGDRIFGTK